MFKGIKHGKNYSNVVPINGYYIRENICIYIYIYVVFLSDFRQI